MDMMPVYIGLGGCLAMCIVFVAFFIGHYMKDAENKKCFCYRKPMPVRKYVSNKWKWTDASCMGCGSHLAALNCPEGFGDLLWSCEKCGSTIETCLIITCRYCPNKRSK